jgi:NAD+ synthase
MRDYAAETLNRVAFIRGLLAESGAAGLVFGNSGGKDAALAGILCKRACEDTVGLILPCASSRNYGEDADDARALADMHGVESRVISLTAAKAALKDALGMAAAITPLAETNLAPRLRMAALYAVAAAENRLVCGTGNRSERYVGYFTKWGDGACDFNPIGDLTVTEIYEFLRYLGAPESILTKPPSAALYDGQTDEAEMGLLYRDLDALLLTGQTDEAAREKAERMHRASEHKRRGVPVYGETGD